MNRVNRGVEVCTLESPVPLPAPHPLYKNSTMLEVPQPLCSPVIPPPIPPPTQLPSKLTVCAISNETSPTSPFPEPQCPTTPPPLDYTSVVPLSSAGPESKATEDMLFKLLKTFHSAEPLHNNDKAMCAFIEVDIFGNLFCRKKILLHLALLFVILFALFFLQSEQKGELTNPREFVRTLVIAVCRSALVEHLPMIDWGLFIARAPILIHFIKSQSNGSVCISELEAESLYAAQDFVYRFKQPQGSIHIFVECAQTNTIVTFV